MRIWFLFTPEQVEQLNPVDPRQYTPYKAGQHTTSTSQCIDKIYAINACCDHEGLPIIDASLHLEMEAAIRSGYDSKNIILRQEYFQERGSSKVWYHL